MCKILGAFIQDMSTLMYTVVGHNNIHYYTVNIIIKVIIIHYTLLINVNHTLTLIISILNIKEVRQVNRAKVARVFNSISKGLVSSISVRKVELLAIKKQMIFHNIRK